MSSIDEAKRALEAAIVALYTTFSAYPLRAVLMSNGKPCYVDGLLHSASLARLTWQDGLQRYAAKAMSLWGDSRDYRHFLPRMLELLAVDPPHFNEEVIFYNVNREWHDWPNAEQEAIATYLNVLWRYTLHTFDPEQSQHFVADIPCCIGQVMDDLTPYLDAWTAAASPNALRLLASYIVRNRDMLVLHNELENPYWSSRPAQMRQVMNWLFAPITITLLEEAFLTTEQEPHNGEFADALDVLNGLR